MASTLASTISTESGANANELIVQDTQIISTPGTSDINDIQLPITLPGLESEFTNECTKGVTPLLSIDALSPLTPNEKPNCVDDTCPDFRDSRSYPYYVSESAYTDTNELVLSCTDTEYADLDTPLTLKPMPDANALHHELGRSQHENLQSTHPHSQSEFMDMKLTLMQAICHQNDNIMSPASASESISSHRSQQIEPDSPTLAPDIAEASDCVLKHHAEASSTSSSEMLLTDEYEMKADFSLLAQAVNPSCSPNFSSSITAQSAPYPSSPASSFPSSSPPQIFSSSPPSTTAWLDTSSDAISEIVPDEGSVLSEKCFDLSENGVYAVKTTFTSKEFTLNKPEEQDIEMRPSANLVLTSAPVSSENKRKRSLEDMGPPPLTRLGPVVSQKTGEESDDKIVIDSRPVPVNKRPTIAFQKLSHKKLASPFRSPAMKIPAISSSTTQNEDNSKVASSVGKSHITSGINASGTIAIKPVPSPSVTKSTCTKRAAAQFKSPFLAKSNNATFLVRLTPTVQALQRDVQILKRAVKVRQGGEEEQLEKLVRKWTEAGREVAYELWDLVKDYKSEDRNATLDGRAKRTLGSWGWEGTQVSKGKSWGFDDMPDCKGDDGEGVIFDRSGEDETEEEDKGADTLGTMLRQLGIAPETLGWDEEEGVFVGE